MQSCSANPPIQLGSAGYSVDPFRWRAVKEMSTEASCMLNAGPRA